MQIGPKMPREEDFVLPRNAIRQLINPYKANGQIKTSFLDTPARVAFKQPAACVGTFWHEGSKKFITLNLGLVSGQIIQKYRVAASASMQDDLSRVEAATSYLNKAEIEHSAERSEHCAESSVLLSGSYVIPGQSLMGENKC